MKKEYIFLSLLLTFLIFLSCSRNTGPTETYTVSGTVSYRGVVVPDASVSIDNNTNFTTYTDQDGSFEINNVPEGDHVLVVQKIYNDGSFAEMSSDISVNDNLDLGAFILPAVVNMYDPTNVTSTSMTLSWSPSDAGDFREYKLYRGTTSGLDETTGTLAHVSTAINDTVFTDETLLPLQIYYYRVYVMNNFGRLGGSNIVSAETENFNVIENGDFEILNPGMNFPEGWQKHGYIDAIFLEDQDVYSGSYCIRYSIPASMDGREFWIAQDDIDPALIIDEARYKLSGYFKISALGGNISFNYVLRNQSGTRIENGWDNTHPSMPNIWEEFDFEFTIPSNTNSVNWELLLHLIKWTGTDIDLWIDEVKLERID